jgi:hypothetical protein
MSEPLASSPALTSAPLPKGLFARSRFYLFAGLPMVALLFAGGAKWVRLPGGDPRLVTREFRSLEAQLGRRLYAPVSAPPGVELVPDSSPTSGAYRVLQPYTNRNSELALILAQEPRNAERDAYHNRLFVLNPDRKVDLDGKKGYFITGSTGERRLYWKEKDASIILSSSTLPDEVIVAVALKVRQWPEH